MYLYVQFEQQQQHAKNRKRRRKKSDVVKTKDHGCVFVANYRSSIISTTTIVWAMLLF